MTCDVIAHPRRSVAVRRTRAARAAERMPDIVKFAVVGVGLDPPPVGRVASMEPLFAGLERLGIVHKRRVGPWRQYCLTGFGREIFAIVRTQSPSEPPEPKGAA